MHIKHAIRTRFHDFHIMNDWPLQMTFFLTKHKSLYGFSPLNGPDDALEPFIHFDHSLNVPLHVFHELSLPWRFCSWKHFWGVPLLDSGSLRGCADASENLVLTSTPLGMKGITQGIMHSRSLISWIAWSMILERHLLQRNTNTMRGSFGNP